MVKVNIDITAYVAEYAIGKYWNADAGCVRFPASTDLYILIYDLMTKRPADNPVDRGNLCFALPDRREANHAGGKSPEQYNYISQRSAAIIENKLRTMMWAELHDFMDEQKHRHGAQFKESAYIFLNRYAIGSISEDALLKHYQRWRSRVRQREKRAYRFKS